MTSKHHIEHIGIIGGGQLGRMMALAARAMGYRITILDPTPHCPCAPLADRHIIAAFDDVTAARQLLEHCDIITYEFENVSVKVAQALEAKLPQGWRLLEITQHRIKEKNCIVQAHLPVAPYQTLENTQDWQHFAAQYDQNPHKVIIKTAQGGYDGKGQYLIENSPQLHTWLAHTMQPQQAYIAENFVDFEKELSVIICRNAQGETATFEVAENIHRHHILHQSIAPARIDAALRQKARHIAEVLATQVQLVGTLAIELFLVNGELWVNEMAPRPHNSGHYTIDACLTSQFEQHIRAICGLPLGSTELVSPCVMLNILGEDMPALQRPLIGKHKLHLYEKTEARAGRKMGHINILEKNTEHAIAQAEALHGSFKNHTINPVLYNSL
ncbi:MAG: 5-(carboxyamino)imidazole ribonucleotide synthase [Sphingobacteriales bacterium]|nr:5-(carboxyamino)imidazole ribonucleotide synthase [Sphingobacteriales bacterium]